MAPHARAVAGQARAVRAQLRAALTSRLPLRTKLQTRTQPPSPPASRLYSTRYGRNPEARSAGGEGAGRKRTLAPTTHRTMSPLTPVAAKPPLSSLDALSWALAGAPAISPG